MTDDVYSTFAVEPRISSTPHSIRLVCLHTDGFDHRLSVLRHEERDVEQDRVGDLSDRGDLWQGDVCFIAQLDSEWKVVERKILARTRHGEPVV
jgi:hypothetical protein